MNWNRAEDLLEKYYEGTSTLQEEQELKTLLQRSDLPPHLKAEAGLFDGFNSMSDMASSMSDDQLFSKIEPELTPSDDKNTARVRFLSGPYWQVAAAVSLLVVGYWAGNMTNSNQGVETGQVQQQSSELAQIKKEVSEMKQMLSQSSPSQRIQAVSYVQEEQASDDLLEALIETMHFDDNVNVRIAAVNALLHYPDQPVVRRAMIHSLQIQEDPNVQLVLIDALVDMDEKKAVPQMQKLLTDTSLQKVVKARLQQSIGRLI